MDTLILRPAITLCEADHRQLLGLAVTGTDAAENLASELDRANVVADPKLSPDIVRLGSSLRYRADDGREHDVTLVLPEFADIAEGRVSVLTPIGTALIGLRDGQSITWTARDGRDRTLTVVSVTQPA